MSVIDDTVKEIMASLEPIETGDYGEAVLYGATLEDSLPLEVYQEREPDCLSGLSADLGERYERLPCHPPSLLGCYHPMKSPGTLILFKGNLARFYRSLLRTIMPQVRYLSRADIEAGARLVTLGTYYHERFHFDCDLLRNLFNTTQLDPLIEEALAMAYERLRLATDRKDGKSKISRMNGALYSLLMRYGYVYTSPGYRDWSLYADETRFSDGLLNYLQPGNHLHLQASGVATGDLLVEMLGMAKGGLQEKAV